MKETILKELNRRKFDMYCKIAWHKEVSDYEATQPQHLIDLSNMRGKVQEVKEIISFVEGL